MRKSSREKQAKIRKGNGRSIEDQVERLVNKYFKFWRENFTDVEASCEYLKKLDKDFREWLQTTTYYHDIRNHDYFLRTINPLLDEGVRRAKEVTGIIAVKS